MPTGQGGHGRACDNKLRHNRGAENCGRVYGKRIARDGCDTITGTVRTTEAVTRCPTSWVETRRNVPSVTIHIRISEIISRTKQTRADRVENAPFPFHSPPQSLDRGVYKYTRPTTVRRQYRSRDPLLHAFCQSTDHSRQVLRRHITHTHTHTRFAYRRTLKKVQKGRVLTMPCPVSCDDRYGFFSNVAILSYNNGSNRFPINNRRM